MSLKSFNQTLYSAYHKIDKEALLLKSSFICLCSDVDRLFRESFGITIFDKLNKESFKKILDIYPNFRLLSLEQFNRLLFTFITLRDVNAHVYLNRKIYLDDDLADFIYGLIKPTYNLSFKKEITIYGAICVFSLFAAKYQMWTFSHQAIRHNLFKEITKSTLPEKQREIINELDPLIGLAKPSSYIENRYLNKNESFYMNEILKTHLTKLIFDLEDCSSIKKETYTRTKSFKEIVGSIPFLSGNQFVLNQISELRNFWVHGHPLFGKMIVNDYPIVFDFDELFRILKQIKEVFDKSNYKKIIFDINDCAQAIIDFFTLRLLEVSQKILDKRLFKKEKMNERIKNSVKAYERLMIPDVGFYNKVKELINGDKITWYLTKGKFEDLESRTIKEKRLKLIKIYSLNGFDIEGAHFDSPEMVLVASVIDKQYQQTINGMHLDDFETGKPKSYSFFDIYNFDFDL